MSSHSRSLSQLTRPIFLAQLTSHTLLPALGYKASSCILFMAFIPSPLSLSRMDQSHFIGNFASPAPLDEKALGPPSQIAYYSHFPGSTDEYEYQSRSALKLYSPPTVPFSFIKAPDKTAWSKESNHLDSLSRLEVEPIVASCQQAGCTVDLLEADVITRRGALVSYVCFLAFVTLN